MVSANCSDPWVLEFMVPNITLYRKHSTGKWNFVRFLFSSLKWTIKSANIRTRRLIIVSQYSLKLDKKIVLLNLLTDSLSAISGLRYFSAQA
jgi:hypothetical protein